MTLPKKVIFENSYKENSFIGIKYQKDSIIISLPLGYEKSIFDTTEELNSEQKVDLLFLLKTINLAKSYDKESAEFGNNIGDKNEIPFNSFLWIINDYFNNGLYQDIEKKYTQRGHGKINWKRTLNAEHFFNKKSVDFINPFYETNIHKNNLITELNNYCLHVSSDYIGFLFGKISLPECSLKPITIQNNINYYIELVNKEFSKAFNDRKKILLTNIKRILTMSFNNNFEIPQSFGTMKYEYAWENMVIETLGSKINISKFFPNAYWNINGKKEEDKSKLRPDSIYIDKKSNKAYILDAKYYKYGVTGLTSDLPHTDSIQKQITYGDHILNNPNIYGFQKNNIYNAFIIPFNKKRTPFITDENIIYLGYANSAWRKEEYTHERVALLLIDMKYMIDCFYQKEHVELEKMVKLIEKSKNKNNN